MIYNRSFDRTIHNFLKQGVIVRQNPEEEREIDTIHYYAVIYWICEKKRKK